MILILKTKNNEVLIFTIYEKSGFYKKNPYAEFTLIRSFLLF
ncbi:hypothetical protein LEP1GSC107_0772 [Leptospira interrogans serovar Grippotyphosa str. UI 12769]|nr:hypothetical protein LEP1GSC097_0418 [Leptospira interrogans serovar Grippotyphosa str. UI 08368]EMN51481.1 hypothetical protein LEP1GSC089_0682 [Leptospira interrogans serovar Autumnalis str. LP101]EMN83338.1 hypothetical protein LEP1GSC107_0772 [Leptospira interrogans serovar Grippotyphosa str. UI 12769]